MDAETLDLCKENIQPLKQGRRANKLGLALLAQTDADVEQQLLKEREQHELEIMTYDGPDPLEPRYEYVHWIEQSCPKHGKEVNLIPLLEDTIMLFKEDDRYKQDTRFIELIVKYIETQENPIELFQMVYAQGLGTECASFYKAWADQLDMINDLQRADQVFQLALSNNAEPKDAIEQAHLRFQMSVGRRMMMGQLTTKQKSVSTETAERQRKVLGKIKKGGSHRPSSGLPGKLPLLPTSRPITSNASTAFTIFQEDENGVPLVKTSKARLTVDVENSRKENTVKPGPWNQGYKRRPAPPTPATPVPSTPTFKVLLDDEEEETPQRPIPATPVPANVLKTRKAELKPHAEELFKSPHPNSKPNLPVFEAFAGGREFSFEELRWAYLSKKMGQKSGSLDETPLKMAKSYTTPCKSSSKMAPVTPVTPHRFLDIEMADVDVYKTPASSRMMYPIMESPSSSEQAVSRPVEHCAASISTSGVKVGTLAAARLDDGGATAPPVASRSNHDRATATPAASKSNHYGVTTTPTAFQSNRDGIPETPAALRLNEFATTATPFTFHSNEDGVYALPSTPAEPLPSLFSKLRTDVTQTPSTSNACPRDTPSSRTIHNIISRPKISKPIKSAPFTIFKDD